MESGLLGLRAELQKKRDEASRHRAGQREGTGRPKEAVKAKAFSSSNAGVSERAARDEEQQRAEERTEERAREVLQRKAEMYDKLQQGVQVLEDDNLNQRFLVNFQKKIIDDVLERKKTREEKEKERKEGQRKQEEANPEEYQAESEDQEWVEYTDAFGRTRECLKSELAERLEQDRQLSKDVNPQNNVAEEDQSSVNPRQLEDLHREALHRKWETEEMLNATKKDLHYQDILYDEARSHGAGFMKFSKDEKERKAQMELLQGLRAETQRATTNTAAAAAKKKKALQARLEKVRQRKRLKMGLPMKDDDKLKTPPPSDEEEEEEQQKAAEPTPPSPPPRKKVTAVREWDIGKEGVSSTLTQEEWVMRQRSQRSQEFAPPSNYEPKGGKAQRLMTPNQSQDVPQEFSPPSNYEPKSGKAQWLSALSQSQDVPQEFAPPSRIETRGGRSQGFDDLYQPQFCHKSMREDPPPDPKEPYRQERRPEFAPPATHEYYGPTLNKAKNHRQRSTTNVEAAISKGLAHLRKMSDQ